MVTTLRDEIKQNKPFTSLEQEVQLNIVRTGALLMDEAEQILRPYGITATQFNVLRILRGSEPDGLCRNELRDRMLTRMPDTTGGWFVRELPPPAWSCSVCWTMSWSTSTSGASAT
jgi:hypothetical protein